MTGQGVLIEEDASQHAASAAVRRLANKPTPPPPSIAATAWLALERRRRDLEAQLKAVVSEQERARARLLDEWSTAGIDRERVEGLLIHTQRKLYPKVVDKPRLTHELLKEGLTDLLTVDDRSFAIYVTAMDEEGRPLPDSIAAYVFEKFERFAVVARLP